ncbi:MAG TPA: DEAD/DEAH box helicase [bacterium]|nr:DEAD/DEAH box helicase [bacterium]
MNLHVNPERRLQLLEPWDGDDPPPQGRIGRWRGRPALLLPVTEDAWRACTERGIPARHPMELEYDWPGDPPAFAAQKTMAAHLVSYPRSFNLSEMGTGKTRATLYAIDWLINHAKVAKRALVVAPLSTLRFVWQDEVHRNFRDRLQCVVLHGSRRERLAMLTEKPWNLAVINHHGLKVMLVELMAAGFDIMAIDEIAVFRNGRTGLAQAAMMLANGPGNARLRKRMKMENYRIPYVWGMTGTPTPQAPTDVWAQKRIVVPGDPTRFTQLRAQTMTNTDGYHWEPRKDAHRIVRRYLMPAVRFRREEMFDLPPVTVTERDVPLTPAQKKAIKALRRDAVAQIGSAKVTAVHAAAVLIKALQIHGGAVINDFNHITDVPAGPRYDTLLDIAAEVGSPMIVFVPFRALIPKVEAALAGLGEVGVVHGGVAGNARLDVFRRFQDTGELRFLVAHPKAMAHGVTLTRANTVVWFLPIYSAETYEQANARIARVSQKQKRLVVHMVSGSLEARLYHTISRRLQFQEQVLDLFDQFIKGKAL